LLDALDYLVLLAEVKPEKLEAAAFMASPVRGQRRALGVGALNVLRTCPSTHPTVGRRVDAEPLGVPLSGPSVWLVPPRPMVIEFGSLIGPRLVPVATVARRAG
jgi:hypothetical protein